MEFSTFETNQYTQDGADCESSFTVLHSDGWRHVTPSIFMYSEQSTPVNMATTEESAFPIN